MTVPECHSGGRWRHKKSYRVPGIPQGDRYIRWGMVEAACKAPAKDYAMGRFYRRIAMRRGPLKARVAVARKLLVAVWHVLTYREPYCSRSPEAV